MSCPLTIFWGWHNEQHTNPGKMDSLMMSY